MKTLYRFAGTLLAVPTEAALLDVFSLRASLLPRGCKARTFLYGAVLACFQHSLFTSSPLASPVLSVNTPTNYDDVRVLSISGPSSRFSRRVLDGQPFALSYQSASPESCELGVQFVHAAAKYWGTTTDFTRIVAPRSKLIKRHVRDDITISGIRSCARAHA